MERLLSIYIRWAWCNGSEYERWALISPSEHSLDDPQNKAFYDALHKEICVDSLEEFHESIRNKPKITRSLFVKYEKTPFDLKREEI